MITTVRETVNGHLFLALGEGFFSELPMPLADCHPLLLGALTGVLATIPFGAPLLVAMASLVLLTQASTIQAFSLLVFGSELALFGRILRTSASDRKLRTTPIHLGLAGTSVDSAPSG